jgi:DNA (cytosine-5)-methyltransferase 1
VERTGESRGQDPVVAVSHDPAVTLTAREKKGPLPEADLSTVVAHSLRGESFDASEDGTGRGTPLVPVAGHHPSSHQGVGVMTVTTLAIRGRGDSHQLETREDGTANALLTPNGGRGGIGVGAIHYGRAVRRLTPRECERLQGFPDDYTMIPWRNKPVDQCPDGPRYKALGNSMAVPCMEWIGEGIDIVEEEANG